ncbi:MAG: hypothetical protein ACRDSP_14405 [Pseudonocardiaceae bacterium]
MGEKEQHETDGNDRDERSPTTHSSAKGRRAKIAAAAIFVLTTVSALIVQDLYGKAKNAIDPSPFSVFVAPYDACPEGRWLFPADFDVRTLPGFDQLNTHWAYEHGGYNAEASSAELTFQAKTEGAVVLHGMRIRLTERKAPIKGIIISKCPIRIKQGVDVRRFQTDLDDPEPSIAPEASQKDISMNNGSGAFKGFPYRISQSEPEVFQLVASTTTCSCTWQAELDWTASGKSGTTTIDMGSAPFRTAATDGAEKLIYGPDGTLHK